MNFQFSVSAWSAYSPYHHQLSDWQTWEKSGHELIGEAAMPRLDFIPALQRRRLNMPARLMFAALHDLPQTSGPLIYASHNGEINRAFSLWLQLLREGAMSPMSFGLSVHNALSGAWSLLTHNQAEMNALSTSGDELEIALLEAYLLLTEGAEVVTVCIVEAPLDEQYKTAHIPRVPFPYALALEVRQGEDYELSFQGKHYAQEPQNYAGALDFITAELQDAPQQIFTYPHGQWQLARKRRAQGG